LLIFKRYYISFWIVEVNNNKKESETEDSKNIEKNEMHFKLKRNKNNKKKNGNEINYIIN